MKKELTCIRCPIGCPLTVDIDGKIVSVAGNSCPRGKEYGIKEATNPTRMVTGSIAVINGVYPIVSVKTNNDIPKDMIFSVMEEIHKACVVAPIKVGDVIIHNVAETNSDIVATRNVAIINR